MIIDTQIKGPRNLCKKVKLFVKRQLLSYKNNRKNILKYLWMKNLKTVSFFVNAKPCITFLTAYI